MVKPIKNNKQHESALEHIYQLMQKELKPNSEDSNEAEVLSILVKDYELYHLPMEKPNPLEAIRFRMEQQGMDETALSEVLGYRARKSEILSSKRKLSLAMIRKLHEALGIQAEVLIKAY